MFSNRVDVDLMQRHSWVDRQVTTKPIIRFNVKCSVCGIIGPIYASKRLGLDACEVHAFSHTNGKARS